MSRITNFKTAMLGQEKIQYGSVRWSCQHKKELRTTEIVQPASFSIPNSSRGGKWDKNEIGHGKKRKKGQKRERKKLEKNSERKRRENIIAGGKKSRTEREKKKTNLNGF